MYLDRLAEQEGGGTNRVVDFYLEPRKKYVRITEQCDYYYSVLLTKKEFRRFLDELEDLYGKMEDA